MPVEHGRTGVVAAYEWDGVLRARVGEECDPASVGAAARGALRTRGYAILEHKTNQGFTRVCGGESRVEPWDRLWARTVTVEARPRGAETEISVRVQPVGEEGESRAVLVEMLSLLGL